MDSGEGSLLQGSQSVINRSILPWVANRRSCKFCRLWRDHTLKVKVVSQPAQQSQMEESTQHRLSPSCHVMGRKAMARTAELNCGRELVPLPPPPPAPINCSWGRVHSISSLSYALAPRTRSSYGKCPADVCHMNQ